MRDDELGAAFADLWCAIPKVVFSRTLKSVQGNARFADRSLDKEAAPALDATDKDVSIGGANLAAAAIEISLVDELRISASQLSSVAARRSCPRSPTTFSLTWERSAKSGTCLALRSPRRRVGKSRGANSSCSEQWRMFRTPGKGQ